MLRADKYERTEESEELRKRFCNGFLQNGWHDDCPCAVIAKTYNEREDEVAVCGFYRKPIEYWVGLAKEVFAKKSFVDD